MLVGFQLLLIAILVLLFTCLSPERSVAADPPLATSELSTRLFQEVSPRLRGELAERHLEFGASIYIRIFKQAGELELWVKSGNRFELFRTYCTCYFSGKLGPKLRQGDLQVPEGFYYVTPGRMNPWSSYHLSFNIGYPNQYDRHHGRTGGLIMVHGNCVSIGCVAMGDDQIEEIYTLATTALQGGQPYFRVHIFPFRMEGNSIELQDRSGADMIDGDWSGFWMNLKEGYDYFEEHGVAPNVEVEEGRYIFSAPGD